MQTQVVHSKEIYNIIDFIGDMGGILDLIVNVFGCLFFPITLFSYRLSIF